MNWSHYQQAIFEAVAQSEESLVISAVAGSGKTTTILEAVRCVPSGKSMKFVAFGKAIATALNAEFRERGMPEIASTLHSVGWTAWRRAASLEGACKITEGGQYAKTHQILAIMVEHGVLTEKDRWQYSGQMGKLISLAKGAGIVPEGVDTLTPASPHPSMFAGLAPDTEETWQGLIDHYGLDEEQCSIPLARRVLAESIARGKDEVDFDDMQFLPLIYGVPFERYDVVFVDESQDVAPIQLEILTRMARRVIAVGDRFQSIYGFRGAHAEAMQLIAERFQCKSLPLSISYRCPKAVVLWAKQWVPHLEYAEDAKDGYVGEVGTNWRGQAEVALGAPVAVNDHEDGITQTTRVADRVLGAHEPNCYCTHSFFGHVQMMVHDTYYMDRCREPGCGCLSYIPMDVEKPVEAVENKGGDGFDCACIDQSKSNYGELIGVAPASWEVPSSVSSEGVSKFRGSLGDFYAGDAILCRVNRPLVALAFKLIRARIPAKILGKEIGQGLVALVKKLQGKSGACSLEDLQIRIDRYRAKETERLNRRKEYGALGMLEDKLGTVEQFMGEVETVGELIREIEALFGDQVQGVTLATVHKAKGLEFDRVFILDSEEWMPSPWARQTWEMQQERNLMYVAATRAKTELRYIRSSEI